MRVNALFSDYTSRYKITPRASKAIHLGPLVVFATRLPRISCKLIVLCDG